MASTLPFPKTIFSIILLLQNKPTLKRLQILVAAANTSGIVCTIEELRQSTFDAVNLVYSKSEYNPVRHQEKILAAIEKLNPNKPTDKNLAKLIDLVAAERDECKAKGLNVALLDEELDILKIIHKGKQIS